VSGRLATPKPDAAWVTVCFRTARTGRRVLRGDGLDERSSLVVWRSDTAQGPALVRFDPLSSTTKGGGHPYSHPSSSPSPCPHPPGPLPCDVHLWVDADSPERAELVEHADVLVSRVPLRPGSAHRRVRDLLARHRGCLAAAVPDTATGCVVGVRDRTGAVSVVRLHRGGADAPIPLRTVVSVVHAWAVSGESPRALRSVAAMPRH